MRVVLTGGGTGGHFFPLIAVAEELRIMAAAKKIVDVQFLYVGAEVHGLKVFEREDIAYKFIYAGKLRRYASVSNIGDLFRIPIGIIQSFAILFSYYPDVIFSKGGFGAVPVVVAGWLLRIPIFIHESDSVPGLANKWSSKFARRIAVSFPDTIKMFPLKKTAYVGNPVRLSLAKGTKESAKQAFQLVGGRKIVLILGGSQGSQVINEEFLKMLPKLLDRYELIHQCGTKNIKDVENEARTVLSTEQLKYYHPIGFLTQEELASAFAACDIIVSRAGSGSIFEIALVGKPCILVPLPEAANDHQRLNAHAYAQNGAGVIIEQTNFYPGIVSTKIEAILSDQEVYGKMSEMAKAFSKPEAAAIIAEELIKLSGLE
jgi:UDP-N-acetylglucosamine--N-acetylmuramyl-(pentapeptide) pyrophosphoryl-undecaprenol N-acetylglucosamine transferase